ncbi:MAG: lytic transglycosylase domain-containing protein, partial [Roseovarius sp.]|nr:lytic transglycosylase domain-containing protein [Roseovarius sp.]
MLRVLILAVAVLCPPLAAVAQEVPRVAPRPLASAFDAMRAGRWDVAARLALRDGPAAAALIEWYRLRAGRGTPREIMDFLDSHGHWPGLPLLRRESEEAMTHAGFDDVLDFYQDDAPRTGTGVLNHARALVARGQVGAAEAGVVLAWRSMDLTEADHAAFLDAHGGLLAPHHAARLDMALWRGLRDVALMLPLVPEVARERAEIRQRIEDGRGEVDDLLRALPPDARSAPGIAHAVFNRHIAEGESDRAIEVILRQSRIAGGLGRAERWSGWRRALARAEMRRGNAETAYELAAFHQLSAGARFADLEWLAGYVALRYLDAPGLALDHFQRLRSAVQTPISLGR